MKAVYYLYGLACCCAVSSCKQAGDSKTVAANTIAQKPSLPQPFRSHHVIEVAPGLDFDVMSWGRGSDSTGAYLILRSDSAEKQYTTTTADLDGKIIDVFNSDLDTDGNPEIFIQSQTADSTHYGKIDAYEFNDDKGRKLDFPKLTSKQKKGYHGEDKFVVKEGKLIRTYPIYDSDNRNAKSTGQSRVLEYSYHGNDFSVKQVSTDSTSTTTTTAQPVAATSQPEKSVKQEEHHSSRTTTHHRESRHREVRRHESSKRRSSAHHRESEKRRRRHRR
ncbi:hypothetical protein GCM10027037_04790 [Mucilaginibacter koreensis]